MQTVNVMGNGMEGLKGGVLIMEMQAIRRVFPLLQQRLRIPYEGAISTFRTLSMRVIRSRSNRQDSCVYPYQARGLPIGSEIVEAACKTLATQRLKRSRMSWRDGKQAMLTIRSLQQSQRWSAAWGLVSATSASRFSQSAGTVT